MATTQSETRMSKLAVRGNDIIIYAQNRSAVVTVAADGTMKAKGGPVLGKLNADIAAEVNAAKAAHVAGKAESLKVTFGGTVPAGEGWTFERTVQSHNDATPGYDLYTRYLPGSETVNVWFGAADITR